MVTGYELVRDKLESVKICSVVKDVHRTRLIITNLFFRGWDPTVYPFYPTRYSLYGIGKPFKIS